MIAFKRESKTRFRGCKKYGMMPLESSKGLPHVNISHGIQPARKSSWPGIVEESLRATAPSCRPPRHAHPSYTKFSDAAARSRSVGACASFAERIVGAMGQATAISGSSQRIFPSHSGA